MAYLEPAKADAAKIARDICDSEAFMWLMAGSNYQETQIEALRGAWNAYLAAGGGWGQRLHTATCCQGGDVTVIEELSCDAECWCHVPPSHRDEDAAYDKDLLDREQVREQARVVEETFHRLGDQVDEEEYVPHWSEGIRTDSIVITPGEAELNTHTLWSVKFDDEIEEPPIYDPRAAGTLYPTNTIKPIEHGAQEYVQVNLNITLLGTALTGAIEATMCKGCGVIVGDEDQHDYSHSKGRSQV
jgi:hypothetical protein